jgi:hypothetical protein
MPTFDDYRREGEEEGPKPFDSSPPNVSQNLQNDAYPQQRQDAAPRQQGDAQAVFGAPEMPPTPVAPTLDQRVAVPAGDPRMGDAQMARQQASVQVDVNGDRIPQRHEVAMNSVRNPNFDNPIAHLEQAKAIMGAQGIRAAEREYFAAIRAADNIDQREVAQERAAIREQLKQERDAGRRRELVQYDSTLHDMQRAPGFTRANLAFAYMSSGYQSEGVKLLMEASRLDPEMERDPNFIRHLRSFDRRPQAPYAPGNPGMAQGYPADAQRGPPQGPQPGMDGRGQPLQPGANPGDTGIPQTGGTAPRTGDAGTATGPRTGDAGTATAPRTGDAGTATAPRTGDAGTATAPIERMPMPSGTNRPDAANFNDPDEHLLQANKATETAGKITPESRASYEKAIAAADSLDRPWLEQHQKDLQAQFEQAYPKEVQDKVAALAKQRDEMIEKLPAETKTQLAAMQKELEAAKTDADRQAILAKMEKLAPEVFAKDKEIGELTKKAEELQLEMQKTAHLLNSPALMRFALASALSASGDKEGAKKYLQESIALDPEAAKNEAVQKVARDVGLTLDKPVEQAAGVDDATKSALSLLQEAQAMEKEKGFAAAKPLYEQAIAEADKVNKENLLKSFDQLKTKLEDKTLSDEDKQQVAALMVLCKQLEHSPYLTRLNYAVALNNAGEQAKAKEVLTEAAAKDPEAAKSSSYTKLMEIVGKPGTKTSIDELAKLDEETANKDAVAKDPMYLVTTAQEAAQKGDLKTAEGLYKQAIEAADKLDLTKYKADAAEAEKMAKEFDAKGDFAKANMYRELQKHNELYTKLPYLARQEMAEFYNKVGKGDESKALLEQAVKINPNLKDDPTYRKDLADATEISKSAFEKGVDYMKHMGKTLLIDGGSGITGLAVSAMFPGRSTVMRMIGIGAGMTAGGITHYGLSNAMGEKTTLGRSMLWGSVDAAAFMSGAAVHQRMLARYEGKIAGTAAFSPLIERNLLKGEAITALEGKGGFKLVEGVSGAVSAEVAARKAAADEARNLALKDLPMWKSVPLRLQTHLPVAWRFTGKNLESWRTLEKDFLSAQGSKWQYLNPASAMSVTGAQSMRQLEARAMWNRLLYVDAPAMATTSAVFHAPHEASKVGTKDESGHTYSAYDAVTNFGKNVMVDTGTGMFTMGFARQMGGHLFKHSGVAGEVNPLKPPTALPEGASLFSKAAQGKRWMGYGMERYIGKPIGDGFGKIGQWTANPEAIANPALRAGARGLGTVPTAMQIDAQAFYKGYTLNKAIEEQEALMQELQKPLEDAHRSRPAADTTAPAPAETNTPKQTEQPAPARPAPAGSDKPAGGTQPAQPGQGLPE